MIENNVNQSNSRLQDYVLKKSLYESLVQTFSQNGQSRVGRVDSIVSSDSNNSGASSRVSSGSNGSRNGSGANSRVGNNPTGPNPGNIRGNLGSDSRRYNGGRNGAGSTRVGFTGGAGDDDGTPASHLGRYHNRLIAMFDRDGDGVVSDREVLDYVLERREANQRISEKIKSVNSNANTIIQLVALADPNNDGTISDEELISAVLEIRANSNTEIDQSILDLVTSSNSNRAEIFNSIVATDLDRTGKISDLEVLTALLNENTISASQEILYKILGTNTNFNAIKNFLDSININPDGIMSNEEVFNFLLAFRKEGFNIDRSDVVSFLNNNPNLEEIENSIEFFDSNVDGDISLIEYFTSFLGIESGAETGEHRTILEILSNNSRYDSIREIFSSIDSDENGEYSEEELVQSWLRFNNGEINADRELFYTVINNLSRTAELANKLDALDLNANQEIENTELIDFLLKTRSGEITGLRSETLNAILGLNSNGLDLYNSVTIIDQDDNGLINNQEAISSILAQRRGDINIEASTFDTILSYNDNIDEILEIIDLIDTNGDGIFAEDEVLDILINERRGILDLGNPDILNDLISSSGNLEAAVAALNLFDPDENGYFEEADYIRAVMEIRSGRTTPPSGSLMDRIDSELNDSQLINEVIASMDSDENGSISTTEILSNYSSAYITEGIADLSKKAVLDRVLAVTNPDASDILALRGEFDSDNSGTISDEEAALGILRIRAGELIDIGRENLITLLSDNPNVAAIYDAAQAIDSDSDGVIEENEVFVELINNARAGIAESSAARQRILNFNDRYEDLKEIFEAIDLNGDANYTEAELVQSWVKLRKGEFSFDQDTFYQIINELSSVANLGSLLESIDTAPDGTIDNSEMVDFLMRLRRNEFTSVAPEVLSEIYSLNTSADVLESAINAIDTGGDGNISNQEVVEAIISQRTGELAIDSQTFNQILNYNPNRDLIEQTIDFLDKDGNGIFGANEIFDSVISVRNGSHTVSNLAIFNDIINSSSHGPEALAALALYDPDENGIFDEADYIRAQIEIRKANIDAPNTYITEQVEDGVEESELIKELLTLMDTSGDGEISDIELISNYYSSYIISGTPDPHRKAVLDRILEITNPGASNILNIRDAFDTDGSGTVSDEEIVVGLLKTKRGEINNPGRDLLRTIFSDNSNFDEIYDTIELVERDGNGRLENYEVMRRMINHLTNGSTESSIEELILTQNPNYTAMKTAIQNLGIDWSLNGEDMDNQLRALMLRMRKNEIPSDYFSLMLASYRPALLKEKALNEIFDTGIDGVIDNYELVRGLERIFNGEFDNNPTLDNIIRSIPKFAFAYDLVKAEMDAGNPLDYDALVAEIATAFPG